MHEYPLYLISNSMSSAGIRVSNKFQQSLQYAEGIITCSYILKDYHQKHTSPDSRYLVSPLLLDFDKFAGKPFDREKYIAYCGDFGNNKDGIPTLINAFSIISTKYSDYQLRIAGGAKDKSVMINLMALVTELGLEEKIRFMGMIEHNKMPEFLGKASLLALARPYNLQAEAGFPSKIAEYLSTGRPVVVTKVGELNLYLRHKENVFFSDSDDAESFAKCLDMVLSDYPNAFKIGLSGRKVAENFDYKKQTDLIADFLLKND
ncbi:MAG: glycosyltransferase [Flavobacteriaceae bacterium]|nr:glycosyltransferase [Flavobacteriaceae bacterium]